MWTRLNPLVLDRAEATLAAPGIPARAGHRLAEEAGFEWLTVDPHRRKLAIACYRPSAR